MEESARLPQLSSAGASRLARVAGPRRDAHGPARDAPAATVPAPGRRSGGRALPRSLAAAAPPRVARPGGAPALHGAERLAEDRVLLLPLQVPGGARRAGEGASGQVGARAPAVTGPLAAAGHHGLGTVPSELGKRACFKLTLRHRLSPWFLEEDPAPWGLFFG